MRCPRCGLGIDISHLRKRLTKEEAEKVIAEYLFLFNARFCDLDVKDSEDVRDLLRRLSDITEYNKNFAYKLEELLDDASLVAEVKRC